MHVLQFMYLLWWMSPLRFWGDSIAEQLLLKVSCPQSHSARRGQTEVLATMFKIHDRETHLSRSQLTKLSPMNVELKLAMKLIIMEKVMIET